MWDYDQRELTITLLPNDQHHNASITTASLFAFQRGPAVLVINNLRLDQFPGKGVELNVSGINMTELGKFCVTVVFVGWRSAQEYVVFQRAGLWVHS